MSLGRIAEEKIRQAMACGEFDDLKGKGQPLSMEPENPHLAEEARLAHHLLQQNGFSLPWIELVKEIDAEINAARAWLRNQYRLASRDDEWRSAKEIFSSRLTELNRRLRDYNLQAPAQAVQRRLLDLNQETDRATRE